MRPITSLRASLAAAVVTAVGAATVVTAAPAAAAPTELQFGRYSSVNAKSFQSLNYRDNGTVYFKHGRWLCRLGPQPGSVGCKGRPATAPPRTQGVAITQDQQGPWWVPPGTDYRFTPRSKYRPRTLGAGQKISTTNVTCAVPRAGVISCKTPNRAFIISRGWHKFYWPKGDTAHSKNPKARYLPANLR